MRNPVGVTGYGLWLVINSVEFDIASASPSEKLREVEEGMSSYNPYRQGRRLQLWLAFAMNTSKMYAVKVEEWRGVTQKQK